MDCLASCPSAGLSVRLRSCLTSLLVSLPVFPCLCLTCTHACLHFCYNWECCVLMGITGGHWTIFFVCPQLGRRLGDERLHHDGQEQRQHVRHRHRGLLPHHLKWAPSKSERNLVAVKPRLWTARREAEHWNSAMNLRDGWFHSLT